MAHLRLENDRDWVQPTRRELVTFGDICAWREEFTALNRERVEQAFTAHVLVAATIHHVRRKQIDVWGYDCTLLESDQFDLSCSAYAVWRPDRAASDADRRVYFSPHGGGAFDTPIGVISVGSSSYSGSPPPFGLEAVELAQAALVSLGIGPLPFGTCAKSAPPEYFTNWVQTPLVDWAFSPADHCTTTTLMADAHAKARAAVAAAADPQIIQRMQAAARADREGQAPSGVLGQQRTHAAYQAA